MAMSKGKLEGRIDKKIIEYKQDAKHFDRLYQGFWVSTVVLTAFIIPSINLSDLDFATTGSTILGFASGAMVLILTQGKFRDKYFLFFKTASLLERHRSLYNAGAKPYDMKSSDKQAAFALFIANCEEIIQNSVDTLGGLAEDE